MGDGVGWHLSPRVQTGRRLPQALGSFCRVFLDGATMSLGQGDGESQGTCGLRGSDSHGTQALPLSHRGAQVGSWVSLMPRSCPLHGIQGR